MAITRLRDGIILDVNDAYTRISGYPRAEVIGRTATWKNPDDRRALLRELQRSGEARNHEVRLIRKGGEERTGLLSAQVISLQGEQVVLSSFLDITERKRAEEALRDSEERSREMAERLRESEARARIIAANIRDYILVMECIRGEGGKIVDWRYIAASGASLKLLQTPRKGLIGSTVSEVVPGRFPYVHKLLVRVLETGAAERYESSYGDRTFLITLFRIDERAVGSAAIDITERKRAEEVLREANERLIEDDRRKNEFLAMLSHELRNPLAPISNSIYLLEHATPGGEQAKHARQVIDRQAQHMARLIEDLLDVTRISRGKINLQRERVDLDALAKGTAEDHKDVFSKNGIELEIRGAGEPLWVDGDPTRLAQVIGNLLTNSAKFTPRGGRTVLSVEANAHGEAVVRVRDTGVGMSAETLQHLFEPFVQAEKTIERTRGGLGLGLALVKGLIEMHGGRVAASSDGEGRGSELTISLPLQPAAGVEAKAAFAPERSANPRRVLVVEDNEDAAESLREVLELERHDVAVARSGPEGVEAARRYKPDVILCDIGLPELDGYGVARALRADPDERLRSTFLVALSGYALPEDVVKSREAGFDRHVAKPPSLELLETLLAEAPARASP